MLRITAFFFIKYSQKLAIAYLPQGMLDLLLRIPFLLENT